MASRPSSSGYPRRLNGEPTTQTAAVAGVRRIASTRVRRCRSCCRTSGSTSREAESLLARREKDWRKRKAQLDAAAAAVILQDYLDAQPRGRRPN